MRDDSFVLMARGLLRLLLRPTLVAAGTSNSSRLSERAGMSPERALIAKGWRGVGSTTCDVEAGLSR
jgi:hypothetical protein